MGFHNFESVDVDNIYTPVQGEVYNPLMLESATRQVRGLAQGHMKRCGCSWEVYLDQFSRSVDQLMATVPDQARRATILHVAGLFDYLSREEVRAMQDDCLDSGLCIHGIDPDCCPAGCGG